MPLWPICVAGDEKNADLRRFGPGPATENDGTCDGKRWDLRRLVLSGAEDICADTHHCGVMPHGYGPVTGHTYGKLIEGLQFRML